MQRITIKPTLLDKHRDHSHLTKATEIDDCPICDLLRNRKSILEKAKEEEKLEYTTITGDELLNWETGEGTLQQRLLDILTGEYSLDEAREDVLSFRKEKKI